MLNIAIVGSGIAGLASALSLRRAGHAVQVFEASQLTAGDTDGAVAQIGPKVNKILEKWGVNLEVARPVLIDKIPVFGHDGTLLRTEEAPKPLGWSYYQRSRLHGALLRSATAPTGAGRPVDILLNTEIKAIDPEAGLVVTQAGQTYHVDIIIGADGWNSIARKAFPHNDTTIPAPAEVTVHLSVYTGEDNRIVQRFCTQPTHYEKWLGPNIELKLYSIEPRTILIDTALPVQSVTELSEKGLKDALLSEFGSINSPLTELLNAAGLADIKSWFHPNLPRVEEWTLGRAMLIGDAAHPFLPFELPGTSQSITGADALAEGLRSDVQVDDVPERVACWVIPRKERVMTIQEMERKDWPSRS
ncbi:hypothetical protein BDQ94DRAFT_175494 [Aspergillus welwitschiae]|uniref:FAD-binding domain-containing protein n=1 Tax=Aspergillus welwitschiae TaxID=1341132 RepID=A0A3F3PL51_9EURO|nr:hypothetical protein BDQ94DRAFT_175494 [Aspergillus welwitschiae]RDH27578.1 hypothetical protein BDQ94DRAFT_175494 [Aspergillus welwitschiae]